MARLPIQSRLLYCCCHAWIFIYLHSYPIFSTTPQGLLRRKLGRTVGQLRCCFYENGSVIKWNEVLAIYRLCPGLAWQPPFCVSFFGALDTLQLVCVAHCLHFKSCVPSHLIQCFQGRRVTAAGTSFWIEFVLWRMTNWPAGRSSVYASLCYHFWNW